MAAPRIFLQDLLRALEAPHPACNQQWLATLRKWSTSPNQPAARWASLLLEWSTSSQYCRQFRRVREHTDFEEFANTGTFVAASSTDGIARAIYVAPDLELIVQRSADQLDLRIRQFTNQQLLRRDYRASTVVQLKSLHPSAYALLCRWGGNSGGVRSGGDWFDLQDLITREEWSRQYKAWLGQHRGARDIHAEFAFIDLIDEIDTALSTAGIDDANRWRFRSHAQRIREFARTKRARGEGSEVDGLAQRSELSLRIAETALSELASDLPHRDRLRSILAERRSEFESMVARAQEEIANDDDDPYDNPPPAPQWLRAALSQLEQELRITAQQMIDPETLTQFLSRSDSIRTFVQTLSHRFDSWLEWFTSWLPLEPTQRQKIQDEAQSFLSRDPSDLNTHLNALRIRASTRKLLTAEQLIKWDNATIHPPIRFVTDSQIRLIHEQLEAIGECSFDASIADSLRATLESHARELRELAAQHPHAPDLEFMQLSAPLFLRSKQEWIRFLPEVPQTLSRRVQLIVRQSAVFQRAGNLPPTPPVPLTPEQSEIFATLVVKAEQEQQAKRSALSFGVADPRRHIDADREFLAAARRRFRAQLSEPQRSQWDEQTTQLLRAEQQRAEDAIIQAAQSHATTPQPIPLNIARIYVSAYSVDAYQEAAAEAEITSNQRQSILKEVAALKDRLENLALAASQAPTDLHQLQDRAKAEFKAIASTVENAVGKAASDVWISKTKQVQSQTQAIQMASMGQVHLVKKWLEAAGLIHLYDNLIKCCHDAGVFNATRTADAAAPWGAALNARRTFMASLSPHDRRSLDDKTDASNF